MLKIYHIIVKLCPHFEEALMSWLQEGRVYTDWDLVFTWNQKRHENLNDSTMLCDDLTPIVNGSVLV